MNDEIFFDGVKHISANDAALNSGFTRDYIGRLCRDGKVRGRRIGKNWYIDSDSFKTFLVTQEYAKSRRSENLAKERVQEYRAATVAPIRKQTFTSAASPGRQFVHATHTAPVVANALAQRGNDIREKLQKALEAPTSPAMKVYEPLAHMPGGFASAALQAVHIPTYTITPFMEFVHKLVALTLTLTLVLGTYAAVDPQYARFAAESAQAEVAAAIDSYHHATGGGINELAGRAESGITTVAENPQLAAAGVASVFTDTLPGIAQDLARTVNTRVNNFVYNIAFPAILTRSAGIAAGGAGGSVAIEVLPYQQPAAQGTTTSSAPAQSAGPRTVINQPVIQRVVTTDRVVVAGGITEAQLNEKLNQLSNKLTSQMYSISSSAPTPPSSGGFTNNIALSQRIDQLKGTTITNPTITGGSISGTGISASVLGVSGNTDLATTTVTGSLTVNGAVQLQNISLASSTLSITGAASQTGNLIQVKDATGTILFAVQPDGTLLTSNASSTQVYTSLLVAGGATTTTLHTGLLDATNASTTNFTAYNSTTTYATSTNFFATNASTTNLIFQNATGTNATTTNSFSTNLVATNATSTNFFSTNASTTNATSTSLFAVLGHFTTGIIDTLSSTVATITSLTATNLIATNSTTTNATTTNLTVFTSPIAPYFTATSTTASVFPYASSTALTASGSSYFATTGGSVGIGTTSPWGLLSVNPNGIAGPAFVVGSSTQTSLIVTSGGNVAVGTTTSLATFTVAGSGSVQPTNTFAVYGQNNPAGAGGAGSGIYLSSGAGGSSAVSFLPGGGGGIFEIYGGTGGAIGSGSRAGIGGNVFIAGGAAGSGGGAGATDGNVILGKNNSGTSIGNVGVGTSTPGTKFAVEGSSLLGNSAVAGYFVATTTLASTFPYASSTALTATNLFSTNFQTLGSSTLQNFTALNATTSNATSTTFFATTASSTNLFSQTASLGTLTSVSQTFPSFANALLYANGSGLVSTASIGSSLTFSAGTLSLNVANGNTWTGLQQFANSTSTLFSATQKAYFGTTGQSSFDFNGALTLGTALAQGSGGTGISSYTAGDILYANNSGTLTKLPIGSSGNVLTVQAGLPAWGVSSGGGGGSSGFNMWATTTLNLIYPVSTAYPVAIGANATSSANSIFEVHGNEYISGSTGIATTSPATTLSVGGSGYFTGGLGVGVLNTSAGTFQTSGNATVGGTLLLPALTTNSLLYNNGFGQVAAATVGSSLTFSAGALSLNTANANTWSALQTFANASSTLFSNIGTAYFGATATTTIGPTGSVVIPAAGTLTVGGGTTLSSALTYGGVTLSNAVTGTGNMVLSAAPTFTGTAAFANATHSGTLSVTGQTTLGQASTTLFSALGPAYFGSTATSSFATNGALTLVNALTYGGVTLSNAVTGTGNMVLSAGPTFTGQANFNTTAVTTQTTYGATAGYIGDAGQFLTGVNTNSLGLKSQGTLYLSASASASPIAVLTSTGLGVGTTSPQAKIEASDNSAASTTPLFLSNFGSATSSTKVSLAFRTNDILNNTGTTTASIFSVFQGGTGGVPQLANGDLAFSALRSGSLTEGARLTSAGSFGISTSTPWGLLSINPSGITGPALVVGSSTATSFIVTNGGKVGIGTSAPGSLFSMVGPDASGATQIFSIVNSNLTNLLSVYDDGKVNANYIDVNGSPSNAWLNVKGDGVAPIFSAYNSGSTEILRLDKDGKLGVGTTTPGSLLSVQGSGYISSSLFVGGAITSTSTSASTFPYASTTVLTASGSAYFATTGGSVGVGTTTPWGLLSINPNGIAGPAFVVGSSTATSFIVDNGGKVGVGTSSSATNGQLVVQTSGTTGFPALTLSNTDTGTIAYTQLSYMGTGRIWNTGVGNASETLFGVANKYYVYDSGASAMRIVVDTSGKVGIGTTTPSAKLEVVDSSAATTTPLYITNLGSATSSTDVGLAFRTDDVNHNTGTTTASISSILQQNFGTGKGDLVFSTLNSGAVTEAMRLTSSGFLGIGTTTATTKLAVSQTTANPQFTIGYDTTHDFEQRVDSAGGLNMHASGNNIYAVNDNFWVCTGGSNTSNACPAGTPTGQGNLIVANRIGVATSTPRWPLQVAGTQPSLAISDSNAGANLKHWLLTSMNGFLYVGTSSDAYATTSIAAITVTNAGKVGIGTSTPTTLLSVGGLLSVGASSTGQLATMGTATSTFNGDVKIYGKLDVATIDPVYTIDGTKYATYGDSTIGIHEETLKTIELTDKDPSSGKYVYTIKFDTLDQGSDLWLFYQITDFGEAWRNLVVSLTPAFDGKVFYKKVPGENKLVIVGDAPGEVSMRLSGNRFDWSKWPTLRPDQTDKSYKGFELTSKPIVSQAAAAAGAR